MKARLGGGHGPYPPLRRKVHHSTAAQPQVGRVVVRFFVGPPAGLGRGAFFFRAQDGLRDPLVTGVQTCALPISTAPVSRTSIKDTGKSLANGSTILLS